MQFSAELTVKLKNKVTNNIYLQTHSGASQKYGARDQMASLTPLLTGLVISNLLDWHLIVAQQHALHFRITFFFCKLLLLRALTTL